jgi:hypothetical protein
MIFGASLSIVSVFLMTLIGPHTTAMDISWRVFLLGISLGPAQSLFSVAVQNAVPLDRLGVATSSSQFFRQIGATVGAAVFGAILIAGLAGGGAGGLSLDQLEKLALADRAAHTATAVSPALKAAMTHAMTQVFWAGTAIAFLGLVAILLVPELPLRSKVAPPEPVAEPGEGEGPSEVREPGASALEPAGADGAR